MHHSIYMLYLECQLMQQRAGDIKTSVKNDQLGFCFLWALPHGGFICLVDDRTGILLQTSSH